MGKRRVWKRDEGIWWGKGGMKLTRGFIGFGVGDQQSCTFTPSVWGFLTLGDRQPAFHLRQGVPAYGPRSYCVWYVSGTWELCSRSGLTTNTCFPSSTSIHICQPGYPSCILRQCSVRFLNAQTSISHPSYYAPPSEITQHCP